MKHYTLPIIIERDADGFFVSCPALQGCHSFGDTYDEALQNLKEALQVYLEAKLSLGETIPADVGIEHVQVNIEPEFYKSA